MAPDRVPTPDRVPDDCTDLHGRGNLPLYPEHRICLWSREFSHKAWDLHSVFHPLRRGVPCFAGDGGRHGFDGISWGSFVGSGGPYYGCWIGFSGPNFGDIYGIVIPLSNLVLYNVDIVYRGFLLTSQFDHCVPRPLLLILNSPLFDPQQGSVVFLYHWRWLLSASLLDQSIASLNSLKAGRATWFGNSGYL